MVNRDTFIQNDFLRAVSRPDWHFTLGRTVRTPQTHRPRRLPLDHVTHTQMLHVALCWIVPSRSSTGPAGSLSEVELCGRVDGSPREV